MKDNEGLIRAEMKKSRQGQRGFQRNVRFTDQMGVDDIGGGFKSELWMFEPYIIYPGNKGRNIKAGKGLGRCVFLKNVLRQ